MLLAFWNPARMAADERSDDGSQPAWRMLSSPPPVEAPEAAELRGRIFTDLDRLAFGLEMEAAELLEAGDQARAGRAQEQRLGVRLAQRLVAGVWADEVNLRLQRWATEYEARLAPGGAPAEGVDAD
jgi:hypothetical protein